MTIREIAEYCGVSRGTVDRVINRRGKVSAHKEEIILQALEHFGYSKNIAGCGLNVRKSAPIIGVIFSSEGNPFFDDVISGLKQAESEIADYGAKVLLRTMKGYNVQNQLDVIDEVKASISVLILHPINHQLIRDKIKSLALLGIPTITVNSDLEDSSRICYVGSDYKKGGETLAGVMRLITGNRAQLGIITGVSSVLGHVQRQEGFEQHLAATAPGITIAARQSGNDDAEHAYHVTQAMLADHPSIDTLFVVAAGVEGVCRAVYALSRDSSISVFAFDTVPSTVEMMKKGLIKAVVSQQPFLQGYSSVKAAFDIILTGQPSKEKIIMENQIKIIENL